MVISEEVCDECGSPLVPILEHFNGCKYKLEFFGGNASWDKSSEHLKDGILYFWDNLIGTWSIKEQQVPQ